MFSFFDLSSRTLRIVLLTAGILVASESIQAAGLEVAGYGGGLSMDGGIGTHSMFGGQAGIRFAHHFQVFGEGNLTQLLSTTESTSTTTATAKAKLANYGGGFEVGLGSGRKLSPYFVTAAGVGRIYVTGSGSSTSGATVNLSLPVTNMAYYGVGGGFRFYLGKNWGIKPEVRYQRYQNSLYSANAATYAVGLFWHSGE